ncbi:Protein of unknown function [Gryllus bimaculatus]|nr:Protein of unknown function [Gryllus bimaculatus]
MCRDSSATRASPGEERQGEQGPTHFPPPPAHAPSQRPFYKKTVRRALPAERNLCEKELALWPEAPQALGSRGRTMAAQSWVARFLRALTAVALRMRQPARRAFGSVPAAVAICAFVVGIYDFVIGFHYLAGSDYYYFFLGFRQMRYIAAYTAFASSLSDVVLVFGIFQREEQNLQYVVCAVLALFTFCGLMPFIILILSACLRQWISGLWEIPRLLHIPHSTFFLCLLLA